MKKFIKHQCPICGNYTLDVKNEYNICPVCFWEDDGSEENPDEDWGVNHISFNAAKKLWNENYYIKKSDLKFTRKPLGIEFSKDSKEYLDIKKYLDNPEESYKEAIDALEYQTNHRTFNDCDFLLAKNKAFNILNALAFTDNKIGQRAAFYLAFCYAIGYGCSKNFAMARYLLSEIEYIYGTRLKNITIRSEIDKSIITIKLCDKQNINYIKVICDYLLNKIDKDKYGLIKCEVLNGNSILIETHCYENSIGDDLIKDIEKTFFDFINIDYVFVNTKAFKNPHEGVAYFNGAKHLLLQYLSK